MNDDTLSIEAHGTTLLMHPTGGKTEKCWRRGVPYERTLLEHIYAQGFQGTAVDAGAGIGNHTLWLAMTCGLHVAAFEPIRYDVIRRQVALNKIEDRVDVHPVALSDDDGVAGHVGKGRLTPGRESKTRKLVREGPGQTPKPGGNVLMRRLDDFDLHDVSVMKIDVEGMESHVLRGGEQTIRRDRPVIFAETWGSKEHVEIAGVLESWGYRAGDKFSGKESQTPVVRWDPV